MASIIKKADLIVADPLMDEIWRVREELLKKHGGIDGLFKYAQKVERAQKARLQRKRKKPAGKKTSAAR